MMQAKAGMNEIAVKENRPVVVVGCVEDLINRSVSENTHRAYSRALQELKA